jgi:hypothetical protein
MTGSDMPESVPVAVFIGFLRFWQHWATVTRIKPSGHQVSSKAPGDKSSIKQGVARIFEVTAGHCHPAGRVRCLP